MIASKIKLNVTIDEKKIVNHTKKTQEFLFHHQNILSLNSLIYLQELEVLESLYKI